MSSGIPLQLLLNKELVKKVKIILKKTTQIYGLGEFLKTYNFLALKIPIFSFFVKK